jgi:hypothetical protein
MTQEITTISPLFGTPYLTVAEFKQAPTAVDVDDLVGGGSSAVNDQELLNVITRASSWIDAYCGQVLASTTDTESFRARVSRDGFLKVHPRYWPVTEVQSLSYGSDPNNMSTVDVTTCWIEPQAVVVPVQGITGSFVGALGFSGNFRYNSEQFVTMTYTNGYANTVLSGTNTAAATSITVADRTGFLAGQQFQIYDADKTELLKVASTYTPTTGAGAVTLASALVNTHTAGVSVSALPPAVKQAAIYVTSAILKSRGTPAIVMQQLTPTSMNSTNPAQVADLNYAKDILTPYRRIR